MKNAGKACNNRLYRHIRTFEKIVKNYFVIYDKSMFQQMGFRKADFLLLCETMMELDFNNSLHKISCPTLLLYGEKDTANKNASIELAELLKNVELKTIIGAGHEVNIESPQELAEILHAFYERMS